MNCWISAWIKIFPSHHHLIYFGKVTDKSVHLFKTVKLGERQHQFSTLFGKTEPRFLDLQNRPFSKVSHVINLCEHENSLLLENSVSSNWKNILKLGKRTMFSNTESWLCDQLLQKAYLLKLLKDVKYKQLQSANFKRQFRTVNKKKSNENQTVNLSSKSLPLIPSLSKSVMRGTGLKIYIRIQQNLRVLGSSLVSNKHPLLHQDTCTLISPWETGI